MQVNIKEVKTMIKNANAYNMSCLFINLKDKINIGYVKGMQYH